MYKKHTCYSGCTSSNMMNEVLFGKFLTASTIIVSIAKVFLHLVG